MPPVRVLVVDDAVVVRRMVTGVLEGDPDIEVVGVAANGRIALNKIPQLQPDLVTLDVEMPELNGLETLREIRRLWPKLPVLMFSTLTAHGAASTLEALALGASDYVTKPANVGSVAIAQQRIRDELIPKIRALCGRPGPSRPAPTASAPRLPALPRTSRRPDVRVDAVAIGVSTGGPNALAQIVPHFGAGFPVPILIVQHMPPLFTRFLAERLDALSGVHFREAQHGAELLPGTGWVAPGDFHMVVELVAGRPRLALHKEAPENSCRPAVDPLFRSVAQLFGARSLGVVLTGMGQDGLRGAGALRNAGARLVAQDEATSVVWGMPGFIATAGLADEVLPLAAIGPSIADRVAEGRRAAAAAGSTVSPSA